MGYSRDSFYRFKELLRRVARGAEGDHRRKPNLHNRMARAETAVVAIAIEQPAWANIVSRTSCKTGQCGLAGRRRVGGAADLETMRKR